jgi:hypothetical protein
MRTPHTTTRNKSSRSGTRPSRWGQSFDRQRSYWSAPHRLIGNSCESLSLLVKGIFSRNIGLNLINGPHHFILEIIPFIFLLDNPNVPHLGIQASVSEERTPCIHAPAILYCGPPCGSFVIVAQHIGSKTFSTPFSIHLRTLDQDAGDGNSFLAIGKNRISEYRRRLVRVLNLSAPLE